MMRAIALAIAALLLASATAYAAADEPSDHKTQSERVPAPQSLVIVACRVDDLTGTRTPPGTPGAVVMPVDQGVGKWRDLELYLNETLEYECKREQLDLEDAVALNYPRKPYAMAGAGMLPGAESCVERETAKGTICVDPAPVTGSLYAEPLDPNFGDWTQCARIGVVQAQEWNERHPGYAVVGVGCPVPIMSNNGTPDTTVDDFVVGYKLPECPSYLPGTTNRMKCRFDSSAV